jgi:diacylglycerol kinase family enzyme
MKTMDPAATADRILAALRAAGHEAAMDLAASGEVEGRIEEAARRRDIDAVIVGGGDGTVSCAAGHLAGTGKALGVLPLGTMNLFARDLGVPLELDAAVAALARAPWAAVDLGEINGIAFVNHASLGVHPWLIRHREAQMRRRGWGKLAATAVAWLRVLRRMPHLAVEIESEAGTTRIRTPVIVIASNPFADGGGPIPTHDRFDQGRLGVYVGRSRTMFGFIRLVLAALLGRWNANAMLTAFEVRHLVVRGRRRRLRVSIDGEVKTLPQPLDCRIRRGALIAMMPPPAA